MLESSGGSTGGRGASGLVYVCLLAERHGEQFITYSMGGVSASSAGRNGLTGACLQPRRVRMGGLPCRGEQGAQAHAPLTGGRGHRGVNETGEKRGVCGGHEGRQAGAYMGMAPATWGHHGAWRQLRGGATERRGRGGDAGRGIRRQDRWRCETMKAREGLAS